ncbi:MAG: AmmeMemoRadiSam system protein A [Planctomycetota bacterium]
MTEEEKSILRDLAEKTVDLWIREGRKPEFQIPPGPLQDLCGAFVTLRMQGVLRGCIGLVEGLRPLWETVRDMAANAASADPRFPSVTESELPELEIEVSVLSPLFLIEDPEDVLVGTHGLLIRKGGRSGLLLPQVAEEQGWDRETFLDQTCWKAGISPGCWREPGVEIFGFTAEVF